MELVELTVSVEKPSKPREANQRTECVCPWLLATECSGKVPRKSIPPSGAMGDTGHVCYSQEQAVNARNREQPLARL